MKVNTYSFSLVDNALKCWKSQSKAGQTMTHGSSPIESCTHLMASTGTKWLTERYLKQIMIEILSSRTKCHKGLKLELSEFAPLLGIIIFQ